MGLGSGLGLGLASYQRGAPAAVARGRAQHGSLALGGCEPVADGPGLGWPPPPQWASAAAAGGGVGDPSPGQVDRGRGGLRAPLRAPLRRLGLGLGLGFTLTLSLTVTLTCVGLLAIVASTVTLALLGTLATDAANCPTVCGGRASAASGAASASGAPDDSEESDDADRARCRSNSCRCAGWPSSWLGLGPGLRLG